MFDGRQRAIVAGMLAAVLVLSGCGDPALEHRVDAEQARATLERVLNSWKQGETPESWREESPEVVVQDAEWQRGAVLESFEILAAGEAIDANLHCPVKLVIQRPDGGSTERHVTYLVGTSPILTVFRAIGP